MRKALFIPKQPKNRFFRLFGYNLLICSLAICQIAAIHAMPAQVIIIRHGEKNPLNGQLLPKGQSRAGALAAYLTELDLNSTNPPLLDFQTLRLWSLLHVQLSSQMMRRCAVFRP